MGSNYLDDDETQEEDKRDGLELGANDFVAKPFALREMVAKALAISRLLPP